MAEINQKLKFICKPATHFTMRIVMSLIENPMSVKSVMVAWEWEWSITMHRINEAHLIYIGKNYHLNEKREPLLTLWIGFSPSTCILRSNTLIIWGGILRKIWIFKCRLKLQKEDYKKRKANEWIHARGMTLGIRDRVNDSTNHNKCNAIVKYKKVLNLNSLRVCHFDLFFSTSRQKNLTNKISIFQDSHICSWLLRNFYDSQIITTLFTSTKELNFARWAPNAIVACKQFNDGLYNVQVSQWHTDKLKYF